MILAIVGSVTLEENLEADSIIRSKIAEHKPEKIVSGGAPGIDSLAARIGRELGIEVEEFHAKTKRWEGPGGFKERNLKIAEACDHLIRIYDVQSKTYGSGWTRDRAKDLGKPTEDFPVIQTEADKKAKKVKRVTA